jgi:hypothetical protein
MSGGGSSRREGEKEGRDEGGKVGTTSRLGIQLPQMLLPNLNFNLTNLGIDDDIREDRSEKQCIFDRGRAITEVWQKGRPVTKIWLLSNIRFGPFPLPRRARVTAILSSIPPTPL